jgi:acyl-[acyl-carrier-protein]-phospholipid O-acyltransferase/long-chain-fatty-acid--[acyl-carrier-protein] ligase
MTLQSTIFSPALNGSIPELYPAEYVITANGIIRMVTTAAILAGTALGGVILDIKGTIGEVPAGRAVAGLVVVGAAVAGVIVSFGVPRFPAASPQTRFPWSGPIDTLKTLCHLREDPRLNVAVWAKALFWAVGALQIQVINQLGLEQFKLSNTMTSAMITVELVGIAVGSLLAARLSKGPRWYNVLVPSAAAMTVAMFVVAMVPHLPQSARKTVIVTTLGMLGIAGGVYSVPLSGFLQFRPARKVVGKIIAVGNFADFVGILISGGVFYLLNRLEIRPSNCYAIMGLTMAVVTGWLFVILPKVSKDA